MRLQSGGSGFCVVFFRCWRQREEGRLETREYERERERRVCFGFVFRDFIILNGGEAVLSLSLSLSHSLKLLILRFYNVAPIGFRRVWFYKFILTPVFALLRIFLLCVGLH